MKTLYALAIAATATTAHAGAAITDDGPYLGGKFDKAPKAAPQPPQRPLDCRVPIISNRTGDVLYYNWTDSECYGIPEDGGNQAFPTPPETPTQVCE